MILLAWCPFFHQYGLFIIALFYSVLVFTIFLISVAVIDEVVSSKYISTNKKNGRNKNKLFLRRVACLGKEGEIARTICCSNGHPKPWAIFLPTKYKIECNKPDCQNICSSEIIKLR